MLSTVSSFFPQTLLGLPSQAHILNYELICDLLTLTAVQDAMLEELVVPAEIVGKCVRYRLDGFKIMKILLDPKERNNTDYKLETFAAVYRKLSGKDVIFEYPITDA